jgi:hypothetical protein
MGEHHLADLDRQTSRYAAELEPEILSALRVVEPRLRWIIGELSPQPIQPSSALRYFHQMRGTTERLAYLCGLASPGYYSSERKTIDEIVKSVLSPFDSTVGRGDYNFLFALRLRAQTRLLEETQSGERLPLRTIADDSSQSLAVPYFLIDEWLLNWALA